MAMNMYKIKKWGAGALMAFLPTITFLVMILLSDLIQALISFFIVTPFSIFIGFRLMSHPLHEFLEGKGILVLTVDSTGVIEPFVVQVDNPYLVGKFRGKHVSTIFNRDSISYMSYPKKTTGILTAGTDGSEELKINIPKDRNSIAYGFNHFPVLIFNKNLGEFISKDAFAKFESDTFVNHLVLYLNRKVEDLTSQLRDFARYIVEQTRPRQSIWSAGWIKWVIIIGVLLFLGLALAPTLLGSMGTFAGAASQTGQLISTVT